MVELTAVPSEFAGRILVAKLGSAGILAEVRGVSRIYPSVLDTPHVWVEAAELAEARELITTDLEDEFEAEPANPDDPPARPVVGRTLLVIVALVLLVSFGYGVRSCGPQPQTSSARIP